MNVVLQVLLALLIPIGWGILSAYLYDRYCERRGTRPCPPERDAGAN